MSNELNIDDKWRVHRPVFLIADGRVIELRRSACALIVVELVLAVRVVDVAEYMYTGLYSVESDAQMITADSLVADVI